MDYALRAGVYGGERWSEWLADLKRLGQAQGSDLIEWLQPADADNLLVAAEREGIIRRAGINLSRDAMVRRQWWGMGFNDSSMKEPARPCESVYVRGDGFDAHNSD